MIDRRRAERVLVFGDLHLDPWSGPDDPRWCPQRWARLLGRLRERADLLVVVGDLVDLDRGPRPLDPAGAWRRIAARHREWLALFDAPDIVCLGGNHDAWLARRRGWPGALEWEIGALRVRLEHGHAWDGWLKQRRAFASAVTWASGVASRRGATRLLAGMRGAETLLSGRGGDGRLEGRAARWLAHRPELDLLVFGHTHVPLLAPAPSGQWLANAGAPQGGRVPWLRIEGEACIRGSSAVEDGGLLEHARVRVPAAGERGSAPSESA